MTPVLQVKNLNKTMGKRQILQNVSFSVTPGEIFGFLGPNGAGKTTCIKMITGLLRIDSGEVIINGFSVKTNFEKALARVGGIIENPEMYKHLTGRDNLRLYARMSGNVTEQRLNDVIRMVKLGNRIDEKVKKYSLGMRQRLGVAQAILNRPNLLILDEPTNGLDPMGIKELRDTLRTLAEQEGLAVLVSSHLLSEMEMMCDKFGIIDAGRMIDVKAIDDIKNENAASRSFHILECDEPEATLALIQKACPDATLTDGKIRLSVTREEAADLIEVLVNHGRRVYAFSVQTRSLEEEFLDITAGSKDQIV